MKIAFYSAHQFERDFLENANAGKHELIMLEPALTEKNVNLATGCEAVCIFVSDTASEAVLKKLSELQVRFIALRSAGYNHIDLKEAAKLNLKVARVPDYSPYAIAEHTIALMMALNRQIVQAHNRINEFNFSLDGLIGFDMHGKTVGIVGTGKIGNQVAKILSGFGCKVIAYDIIENEDLKKDFGAEYVDFKTLCNRADIISLHTPLNDQTKHIINEDSIKKMKKGVMLINTSRGGLVCAKDVIVALKTGQIGYFGMDAYEEETGLFFENHSQDILQDDVIARLMTFKNVLITSHQAFLTDTALKNIATTTFHNLDCFEKNVLSGNEL